MKTYYPYDPYNPKPITSEVQQVIGGQIRLDHVPKKGTLQIYGYDEAESAVDLLPAQFYCHYADDTLYRDANRTVYFWHGRSGQYVTCSYMAVASPVTAEDMNEINERLTSLEARVAKLEGST